MNCLKISAFCFLLLFSGFKKPENKLKLNWYKGQVNSLYNYDNGNYVVGLGILASAFYLNKNEKNYKQMLRILTDSYKFKKVIRVGYISTGDSGSKIVQVKK